MARNKAKAPPAAVRARDVEIISRTEFEVLGQVVRPQDLEQVRICGVHGQELEQGRHCPYCVPAIDLDIPL